MDVCPVVNVVGDGLSRLAAMTILYLRPSVSMASSAPATRAAAFSERTQAAETVHRYDM